MLARIVAALAALACLASCATQPMSSSEAIKQLAPSGTLRVGINYGNTVLVQRNAATGELRGLAPDLARELARRAGVPVTLVPYDTAGKMADAVKAGAWDVAFLAVDPARAKDIIFTAPYLEIEGAYMVPAGSPIRSNEEVDREGVRLAVGLNSAYDLYLTRHIKRATIVRSPTSQAAIDEFVAKKLEVVAGVKQPIQEASAKIGGMRVLPGRFMAIGQASGVPQGREAAARYLSDFIEDAKASGFVAESLARAGVKGASVAPPRAN
jgi:polar amino acid transport system substrate-binding protein